MPLYEEKLISPLAIRFTQQRIRETFRDGRPVEPTIQEITISPGVADYDVVLDAPFPTIEVIRWAPFGRKSGSGEHWFSYDNRRLYCLQRVATALWPKRVAAKVEVLYFDPDAIRKKLDSQTMGLRVTIGHAFAVGNELKEWSWQMAVQAHGPPGYFTKAIDALVASDDAKTNVHELTNVPVREGFLVHDEIPQAESKVMEEVEESAEAPLEEVKESPPTGELTFEKNVFASLIGQLIDIKIEEHTQSHVPTCDGTNSKDSPQVPDPEAKEMCDCPNVDIISANVEGSHVKSPRDSSGASSADQEVNLVQQQDNEGQGKSVRETTPLEQQPLNSLIGQLLTLAKEDVSETRSPFSDDTSSTRLSELAVSSASGSEEGALELVPNASSDEVGSLDEVIKEEQPCPSIEAASPEHMLVDSERTLAQETEIQGQATEVDHPKEELAESAPHESHSLSSLIGQLLSLGKGDCPTFSGMPCEINDVASSSQCAASVESEEGPALVLPLPTSDKEKILSSEEEIKAEEMKTQVFLPPDRVVTEEVAHHKSGKEEHRVGELLQQSCSLHAARAAQQRVAQQRVAQYEMARWAHAEQMAQWQHALYGFHPSPYPTQGAFW